MAKQPIYRVVEPNTVVKINGKEYTVTDENSVKHGVVVFLTLRSYQNRKIA